LPDWHLTQGERYGKNRDYGESNLEGAADENGLLHLEKIREGELDADREEQEDHADLSEEFHVLYGGDKARP